MKQDVKIFGLTGGFLFLVAPLIVLSCGCSSVLNNKVNGLETKVSTLEAKIDSVEQRQSAVESQTGASRESVGYLKGKVDSRGTSTVVVSGGQGNSGYQSSSGKTSLTHKDIQSALKHAGFYNGPIDGKIGSGTKNAIKKFQKANGLKATGKVNSQTKRLLLQY